MPISIDKVSKVLGSGLLIVCGPQILSGMVCEWIKTVKIANISDWVVHDKRIWDHVPDEWKDKLRIWGPRLGDLKWLDTEWLIKECRSANPGVVSLIINWPDAAAWVTKQLEDLKSEIIPEKVSAGGKPVEKQ